MTNPLKLILVTSLTALSLSACSNGYNRPEPTPAQKEHMHQKMEQMTFKLDANGDGTLTCADSFERKKRLFVDLDSNKDQHLSPAEYAKVNYRNKQFMFYTVVMIDKDGSGDISQAEFQAIPNDPLRPMDKDKDCIITEAELALSMKVERRQQGKDGEREMKGKGRGKGKNGRKRP